MLLKVTECVRFVVGKVFSFDTIRKFLTFVSSRIMA